MNIYDSTLTSKGQTTVPAEVREALNLKPGDKIRYVVSGNRVYLRVKNKRAIDLAGKFYDPNRPPVSIEEMEAAIGDAIVDHVLGRE
ncbi:AbrB/MazE/SpoVT family DNA-binding domain-containing protein [Mycoplana ramosa]|uniref:AbrB/MazE/SpoVT family DNA-binding domain-containing protein n=1 Tax=Mycoplana ramosa TaxID=40837 RepID=A0ABW3YW99_MYCRA